MTLDESFVAADVHSSIAKVIKISEKGSYSDPIMMREVSLSVPR